MKKELRLAAIWGLAALILTSSVAAPAYAGSPRGGDLNLPPLNATSSQDVPDEYLVYPDGTPLPSSTLIMTDEEMEATDASRVDQPAELAPSSNHRAAAADVVGGCGLSVGRMWERASSKNEPHGGVGSKPAVTDCWGKVTKTYLESRVYMHNGWIWFSAAGPFKSNGTGNMQQKSVVYVCKGNGVYPFRVQSYLKVSGSNGTIAEVAGSTPEKKFPCG